VTARRDDAFVCVACRLTMPTGIAINDAVAAGGWQHFQHHACWLSFFSRINGVAEGDIYGVGVAAAAKADIGGGAAEKTRRTLSAVRRHADAYQIAGRHI